MTCRSCWVSVASSAGSRARTPLSSPRQHLRCSASSLSRRTICDRTAATLAGDLGFDDAWIAKCLDRAASKKQEQIVPTVTGKVCNHSALVELVSIGPSAPAALLTSIAHERRYGIFDHHGHDLRADHPGPMAARVATRQSIH
jgi:hypothetical protein